MVRGDEENEAGTPGLLPGLLLISQASDTTGRVWGSAGDPKEEKVGIRTRLLLSTALSIGAASALSSQAGAADIIVGKAPTQQQGAESGGPSSAIWLGGDFKENVRGRLSWRVSCA